MILVAMLVLAYGPLDWTFPWWVWFLALGQGGQEVVIRHVHERARRAE